MHLSYILLLNHSMLNLQGFAFIFYQRPNQHQRYFEFSPVKGVKELVLITRMRLLSIVAVCIDDGHDCITARAGNSVYLGNRVPSQKNSWSLKPKI